MIELIEVKNIDEYYRKLNVGIETSKMWNTLQSKPEVGLAKSERGYQQVARIMGGNIARGLSLNADLAECLVMCQGAFFPAYGKEGKKVVMRYMRENDIEMSEADLARNFVEYDLSRTKNIVSVDFDNKLKELFDVDNEPKTKEVELARMCGKTIESIKKIEMNTNTNQADFVYSMIRDIQHDCISAGELVESDKLQELLKGVSDREVELCDNKRLEIYDRIKSLSRIFKSEKMSGIYEYIGASER